MPPAIDQLIATHIQKRILPGRNGNEIHKNTKIITQIIPIIFSIFSKLLLSSPILLTYIFYFLYNSN